MGPPHAPSPQNKSRPESSVTTHGVDVCLQKWGRLAGWVFKKRKKKKKGDTRDERDREILAGKYH